MVIPKGLEDPAISHVKLPAHHVEVWFDICNYPYTTM
jgi:hypothetical protein